MMELPEALNISGQINTVLPRKRIAADHQGNRKARPTERRRQGPLL